MSDAKEFRSSKEQRENGAESNKSSSATEAAGLQKSLRRKVLENVSVGLDKTEKVLDTAEPLIKVTENLQLDDYEIVYPESGTTELVVVDKKLGRIGKDGKPRGQDIARVDKAKDRFEFKKQSRKRLKMPDQKTHYSYKFTMRKSAAKVVRAAVRGLRKISNVAGHVSKAASVVNVVNALKRSFQKGSVEDVVNALTSELSSVQLETAGAFMWGLIGGAMRSYFGPQVTVVAGLVFKIGVAFASSAAAGKIADKISHYAKSLETTVKKLLAKPPKPPSSEPDPPSSEPDPPSSEPDPPSSEAGPDGVTGSGKFGANISFLRSHLLKKKTVIFVEITNNCPRCGRMEHFRVLVPKERARGEHLQFRVICNVLSNTVLMAIALL